MSCIQRVFPKCRVGVFSLKIFPILSEKESPLAKTSNVDLIKQPLGLFLFFLFITGKRQLVNPSGGWLAGNHIQKLYLVSVPQTQDVGESYDVFQHLLTTRMRFGKYASQSRSKAYLDSHSVFSLPKTSMHMFCSKSLLKSFINPYIYRWHIAFPDAPCLP